jgi:hypothetical protein
MVVAGHAYRGTAQTTRPPSDYWTAYRVAVATCECGWVDEPDNGAGCDGPAYSTASQLWGFGRKRHQAHLEGLATQALLDIATALRRGGQP